MSYYMRYDYDNFEGVYENIISMRHGTCFCFMGCKIKFYQTPRDDRQIIISCCDKTLSKELAEEKIINVAKILSFLFAMNISLTTALVFESDNEMSVNTLLSVKSQNKLQIIEKQIKRFKKEKDFFEGMITLLSIAYENLYNYRDEDAFFYFFKVIEKISQQYYKKYMQRHHTSGYTRRNKSQLKQFLLNYSMQFFDLKLTNDIIDRKTDMLYKNIKMDFYGSIFSKISLFVKQYKINIDINTVSNLVKIRNKIAHGDSIEQDKLSMYLGNCEYIANEIISYYFFHMDYLKLHLKSYRYTKGEDVYIK